MKIKHWEGAKSICGPLLGAEEAREALAVGLTLVDAVVPIGERLLRGDV